MCTQSVRATSPRCGQPLGPVPRQGWGAPRGDGHLHREEPNGPTALPSPTPQHCPRRLFCRGTLSFTAPSPGHHPLNGADRTPPTLALRESLGQEGEGAEMPGSAGEGRDTPPPHPARGLPDPAAAAVRGEHGWAPGPQQLENSLRETIKVDYPVESWSGNYLVN